MTKKTPTFDASAQSGFSYTEVLVSVLLLGILLVPAMEALSTAISGSTGNSAERQLTLRSRMEEVLSQPFSALFDETKLPGGNTPNAISATFSDAPGATDRIVVVLYRFDAATNVLTSSEVTGLVFVSVYYKDEGSANALNTLAGKWW